MTTDRRQQILRLYHLALAREADDRGDFLAEACASDDSLRHDVESLLAQDPPEHFLELPALSAAAVLPFGRPGRRPRRPTDRCLSRRLATRVGRDG